MTTERTNISELEIKSIDIDRSLITIENHNALKALFSDCDDDTIARYLIARNNDLAKSTELLTKAKAWKTKHMPVLKRDFLPELQGKIYVHGTDREGRPLLIFRPSLHDAATRDLETMAKSVMWWAEYAVSKIPDNKSKFTVIIDRDGAGWGQDIEFLKSFTKLFQDQYPERLYRAIVVPTNFVFWSIWKIASVFLHPVTRQKVVTLVFQSALSEYIDPEFIPVRLGGNSQYEFNSSDYEDPYTPEVIEAEMARRGEDGLPVEKGTFFNVEDAASGDYDA